MKTELKSLIKVNRLIQGVSLEALSHETDISIQRLIRYDEGSEELVEPDQTKLVQALHLSHYNPLKNNEYFTQIYRNILYYKEARLLKEYNDYTSKNGTSIDNILLNLMYLLICCQPSKEVELLFLLLKQCISTATEKQKHLYHILVGYNYIIQDNPEKALKEFDRIRTHLIDPDTLILLDYFSGIALRKHGDSFEAYSLLSKAKTQYKIHHNPIYCTLCDYEIGNIYYSIHHYDKAISIYTSILNTHPLSLFDKSNLCLQLLCTYLTAKQFDQFFSTIASFDDHIIQYLEHLPKYLFYKIIATYNTHQTKQCVFYIDKFEAINTNTHDQYIVDYYKNKLYHTDQNTIIANLEKNLSDMKCKKDSNNFYFIYELLISEYEAQGDYKKMCQCANNIKNKHEKFI